MTVSSVEASPPIKSPDTVRHERQAADRREETQKHDEARQAERSERSEPRGKKLDVDA